MSRVPELQPDAMSADQKRVHDAIASGPRGKVEGPLKVWLHSPKLADTAQALGAFCRYGTSLPPRLSELAIIIVGAHWRAGFEWHVHAPLARVAGIDTAVVEALHGGGRPQFAADDERVLHDFVTELLDTRRVSDAGFARAAETFGMTTVVELVGLVGYYTLISMTITAFAVPVPDGAEEPFGG